MSQASQRVHSTRQCTSLSAAGTSRSARPATTGTATMQARNAARRGRCASAMVSPHTAQKVAGNIQAKSSCAARIALRSGRRDSTPIAPQPPTRTTRLTASTAVLHDGDMGWSVPPTGVCSSRHLRSRSALARLRLSESGSTSSRSRSRGRLTARTRDRGERDQSNTARAAAPARQGRGWGRSPQEPPSAEV